jgi:nanoRNase/pAp phosphatase (c-di-AMP/oligoRNAs hydrolase)
MTVRLVLGCGTGGRSLLEAMRRLPGELHAVVPDKGRADALRDDTVDARQGDPTDPSEYPEAVDVVYIASDDPETNLRAAEQVRERFPDAYVAVRAGFDDDAPDVVAERTAALERLADRVIDGHGAVVEAFLEASVGETTGRVARLLRTLRSIDGRLAVVAHDNPDPDAIASALALVRLAEFAGVEADACYYGDISHQENRALVNLLDVSLKNLSAPDDVDEYAGVALVDHSRPGVNDGLDPSLEVDIVVDHHPPRGFITASFLDLQSDVGSTSTLFTQYLRQLNIEPNRTLATALLYGIRVDTRDFSREVSVPDYEAAAFLLRYADVSTLDRVETPSMSGEVLDTLARAIRNRHRRDDILVTSVGTLRDRDALAQAADRLLDMQGVCVTVVYGVRDETIYVSGRARGTDIDIGETLREAYSRIGDAGGHADMAGAQIPVGFLGEVLVGSDAGDGTRADGQSEPLDEDAYSLVDQSVRALFFDALERNSARIERPVESGEYVTDSVDS